MDYLTLRKHVSELSHTLAEKPLIARAVDTPGRSFSLRLKFKERWGDLVFNLDSPNQGFRLVENCLETEQGSSIVRTANRLLTNGRIMALSLAGDEACGSFDRVVKMQIAVVDSFFGKRDDYYIFAEFTGRIADIFICDADHKIIDRMSRTSNNLISEIYRLPDSPPLQNPFTVEKKTLQRIFAAPVEEWKNQLGALAPQLETELLFRCEQQNIAPPEAWPELLREYLDSAQAFVYYYKATNKLKALSSFRLSGLPDCEEVAFACVNAAMNWVEDNLVRARRLNELKKRVLGGFARELKLKTDLLAQLQQLLQKYENADEYQTMGNLLVANLYQIKTGCRNVTLEDWETQSEIEIELDPLKTPAANAQRFFNLYKKFRRGILEVEKRITALNDDVKWLREQIWLSENATSEADFHMEEKSEKVKKTSEKGKPAAAKGRKGRPTDVKPALEIDGCRYYVGRNARQNDVLTFLLARRGDYWFHANDVPGAHVILKKSEGQINETDLYRGALLAACFSFARDSSKVAVDCTDVAFVKKIPGGAPGRVSFSNQKTIIVNPVDAKNLPLS